MQSSFIIEAIFLGQVTERWPGQPTSAIGKQPVDGVQEISEFGFTADAQADLTVHGGPQKAIHHYASDHYEHWRATLERQDLQPGGFGENLATHGLTEKSLAIGDVFRLGSALVQVSQGRQPCWKLNAHTGYEQMAAGFQSTGFTGWYYRVLEPGAVAPGDSLTLVDRPTPEWTVFDVTRARLLKQASADAMASMAALETLSPEWRAWFRKMATLGSPPSG